MQTSTGTEILVSKRNTHKWKGDTCVIYGCVRVWTENPNAKWNWVSYADPETGEIRRKVECKTKQLILNF